jgi:hypothetical protein
MASSTVSENEVVCHGLFGISAGEEYDIPVVGFMEPALCLLAIDGDDGIRDFEEPNCVSLCG